MSQRFRFPHAVAADRTATVTRVAGSHEFEGRDQHRRYQVALDAPGVLTVAHTTPGVRVDRLDDARLALIVPDGVGFATVRFCVDDTYSRLVLPDPTVGAACTDAAGGDETAANVVIDAVHAASALPSVVGPFLGVDDTLSLLDTLTSANETASDDVHAHRFDLVRAAILAPNGLALPDAAAVERLVAGLDDIDAIGDLTLLDALGDFVAGHPTPERALDTVTDLGFDRDALETRDDAWFHAVILANAVRVGGEASHAEQRQVAGPDGGLDAARDRAVDRASDAPDYERVKDAAANADYWDRGAAWRRVLPAAVARSRHEFGYVLANALYWTGEVARTDARVEELLHEAAAVVAADIGLDWIEGHARYERERVAGHRHRSARNHDRAIAHFRAAEALTERYDFLDAWDPIYSRVVVRSNAHSRAGDHAAAVDTLDAGLDDIDALDPPAHRRETITNHLRGQRRERLAILARDDDPDERRAHLDAARDHYAAIEFDRSVDRIDRKLAALDDEADDADAADERRDSRARPQPVAPPREDYGPALSDIPDLHDSLTATDPTAVGSADPGVIDDPSPHGSPRSPTDDDWY
ncbi:hypothetical protein [Halocalculus aciditolerans]|uniref:Uncharacterized protein n=1 Tax=Halocalculus aciditolerans TaxID=1383812 RepID=A0A830F8S2_9EURY|nr:hypothetical protein [Halocalculus aciditolerans]GGL65790.1 hypothetical protein GCM10009039_24620 [Halocalculus aciditolerans]